ncbi:MAG: glutamate mutase L, partial [Candidatus Adiutrix sp.]|nr:glutamate mutase L [Candidatus Adiutrix sp.]
MRVILAADVGSTFTKLTAIDIQARRVIGSAKSFTTIETNVMEGFHHAEAELAKQCGPLTFEKRLASSSAAGGLKMVAVGLVPDLTVQAARLASANAGAKILKTYAYELSRDEVAEIVSLGPDMLLLSGGIDGGNKDVILHNARLLAASGLRCSLVAAGNKSAADDLKAILKDFGEVIFCANVMPEINRLDIEPAKRAIRDLFIKNIITAKGLDELQATLDADIIPTPLSVLDAAALLSKGTKTVPGLGELMVFDVGGATTDVYSMSEGLPTRSNVFLRGFRQPFAKRTVEGDLGLRYSMASLTEAAGGPEEVAGRAGVSEAEVEAWLAAARQTPDMLPEAGSGGKEIDEALAALAVKIGMERHCGSVEAVYTSTGQAWAQTGKDLSNVACVIGT